MDELIALLQDWVDAGRLPGAVVLLARGDEVRVRTVGSMSVGGPPMPEHAIMRIQSMTKAVVAVATLRGVEAGRLALADPVDRWLPELADRVVLRRPDASLDDVEPARRPITVRDLLVNGSGYGMAFGDTPWGQTMHERGLDGGPGQVLRGADDWLAALAELPLAHQPGEGFRYHHSFPILGILLQRAAGTPLEQHLHQEVLDPLGMVDTGLSVPTSQAARLPAAYRLEDGRLVETEPLGGGPYLGPPPLDPAHGELVSTAADYHRFVRMLVDGGRLDGRSFLDAGLVREMLRDQVAPGARTPESFMPGFWDVMGWGYGVAVTLAGEHAGRFGWSGGQGTDFFVDPDGTIAILLTQVELDETMFELLGRFQELARF
ncbi:serine hydrolase domain-containing protein [Ornithinimicrobium cerasi]|uniref:CubicO group peptidase, beta-lactamase class C family n=1 Tax=Ornithinimicrobium cerasi TaxID=2248773 RepID=A0A285VV56_9MICO|nr:serine hydrolase domain-containing protein [Ornithinimicrobium cerasi]SOC57924.1 CubicO group peptidase, beta-lactamase class C family [Ornithinimicrobium cerasi]